MYDMKETLIHLSPFFSLLLHIDIFIESNRIVLLLRITRNLISLSCLLFDDEQLLC